MKKLLIIATLVIFIFGCKKTEIENIETQESIIADSTPQIDTSRSGTYRMVYCSKASEFNSGLKFKMLYKSHKNDLSNTIKKIVMYNFVDNTSSSNKGKLKISATVTYKNIGVNQSQPYIETQNNVISYGFIEDNNLKLYDGSFNNDTMILNFNASGVGAMKCKYKKQ